MKKFAKTILSVLVAGIFAMSVTACGNNAEKTTTETESAGDNAQDVRNKKDTNTKDLKGKIYELDKFTVLVPEGWVAEDYLDKTQVKLFKAKDMSEVTEGVPEIDFTYNTNSEYVLLTSVFNSYEDIAPLQLGAYTWEGAKGEHTMGPEMTSLYTTIGADYIAAAVWTKVGDKTISFDDSDVQAIFNSLTVK